MSERLDSSKFRIKLGAPTAQGQPAPEDVQDVEISKVSKDPEEFKFRVRELPFPSESTYLWRPAEERLTTTPLVHVVLTQEVLRAADAHVSQSDEYEIGGFLLGNRYRCPSTGVDYVIIDQATEARHTEATPTSLKFTTETWSQLKDDLSGKFVGKLCLGWYHSHPKMDVFLSGYDEAIQKAYFPELWNSALVIEPTRRRGGIFCWRPEGMNLSTPDQFYELLGRNSAATAVAWTNYECVDQSTGEVIAPPPAESPAADAARDAYGHASSGEAAADGADFGAPTRPNVTTRREDRLRTKWPPAALILAGAAVLALAAVVVAVVVFLSQRPNEVSTLPQNKLASNIDVLNESVKAEFKASGDLLIRMTLTVAERDLKVTVTVDGNEARITKRLPAGENLTTLEVLTDGREKLNGFRQNAPAEVMSDVKVVDTQEPETRYVVFSIDLKKALEKALALTPSPSPSSTPARNEGSGNKQQPSSSPKQTPRPSKESNKNDATGTPTPLLSGSANANANANTNANTNTNANAQPANTQPPPAAPTVTPPPQQPQPSATPKPPDKKEEQKQLKQSQDAEKHKLEAGQKSKLEELKDEKERRLNRAAGDEERRRIKDEFKATKLALEASQRRERDGLKNRHKDEQRRLKEGQQQRRPQLSRVRP